ncbi:zinc ribbon domain-containing protein [Streptomyces sp. NPDC059176]|uniref:zinc ribbon domain-containing protein n=1 Tax=unclassified Streptomyces TaxID=2593676 RepID=UPI00369F2BB3
MRRVPPAFFVRRGAPPARTGLGKAGVPFLEVGAAYTSQRCPRCGHTERVDRPARDHFRCRRCGLAGPADVVAAVNVRDRARSAWAFVTMPVPHPV